MLGPSWDMLSRSRPAGGDDGPVKVRARHVPVVGVSPKSKTLPTASVTQSPPLSEVVKMAVAGLSPPVAPAGRLPDSPVGGPVGGDLIGGVEVRSGAIAQMMAEDCGPGAPE